MKMKLSIGTVFYVLLFVFTSSIALGQEATTPKKWNYLGEIYLMFPDMKGEIGIGNLPDLELDAESNDILGQLKFGAMMYFEANTDKWAISSDLLYMKLGMGASDHKTITSGEATVEELAWELAGLRKINPWLDLGVGARLVYLYTGLELQTINNQTKSASISETWVDPVLIMRSQNYFNKIF